MKLLRCVVNKGKIRLDFQCFILQPPKSPFFHILHPRAVYLHIRGGGGTGDNLDQLASNDGLTGSIVENLVLANHLSSVLGGVL